MLFSSTLTKLAFWRKTPAVEAASAEPDARDATEPDAPEADEASPEAAPAPDGTATAVPEAAAPARESLANAAADATEAPASRPALLARLLGRLRRRPAEAAADEATDEAPASADRARDEADEADDEAPPARMRRMRAMLARRGVWIPAAGVAGLALVGTLGVMLWQSGQQNAALQARLKATEKQLEQARPAPTANRNAAAAGPRPGAPPAVPAGTAGAATPVSSGGDCDIGSAEGVSLRLKDCIDAFNRETTHAGPTAR